MALCNTWWFLHKTDIGVCVIVWQNKIINVSCHWDLSIEPLFTLAHHSGLLFKTWSDRRKKKKKIRMVKNKKSGNKSKRIKYRELFLSLFESSSQRRYIKWLCSLAQNGFRCVGTFLEELSLARARSRKGLYFDTRFFFTHCYTWIQEVYRLYGNCQKEEMLFST